MISEYEFEPVRGLPATLPDSEPMLWQGSPTEGGMARRVFHTRKLMVYFSILVLVSAYYSWPDGAGVMQLIGAISWQLVLAVSAFLVLFVLAKAYARTTVYTITEQRLVMRFGVAVPMMINLPWSKIEAVNLQKFDDGTGDIEFVVEPGHKLSYWVLWPNVKPWHFSRVTPALRSIADAEEVAAVLGEVLRAKYPASQEHAALDETGDDALVDLVNRPENAALS